MLFRKKIERSCSYCQNGTKISETQAACLRHGIVPLHGECRFFSYDPFLRVPPAPPKIRTQGLTDEDFKID